MLKFAKICLVALVLNILLGFFSVLPVQAAGNAVMVLTSPKTTYNVGENVYINIEVKTNGESINVARAIMDFTGAGVLSVSDFNIGTALPYVSPGKELNNTTGHINIGGFLLVESVNQDFLLGTLVFKANQAGTSDIGKPFLIGSHLISPDQIERINLAGCQGITINVIEAVRGNNPPIVLSTSLQTTLNTPVATTLSAFDPDGDVVAINWDSAYNSYFSNSISGLTATADFNFPATQLGTFSFPFVASDNYGPDPQITAGVVQVVVNENVVFLPANHAPIFQPVGNKNILLGESVSFQVLATDPDNNNIDLSWDIPTDSVFKNINEGQSVATGDFSWTPTLAGSYVLRFYALDDHSTNPLSASLTVLVNVSIPEPVINRAPVFVPVSNKQIKLGETVNFLVQATDPDGDIVTLTWDVPAGANLTNVSSNVTARGTFNWNPEQDGVYTLVFNATDDNPQNPLTSTLTVSLAVSVPPPLPNQAPIIDPVPEQTLLAGETLNFSVLAHDPDGDNVTLVMAPMETASFNLLGPGSSVQGSFSWQPETYGIYYVLFTATDDHLTNPQSTSLSVRITVFGGECPPCGGGICPTLDCQLCQTKPTLEKPLPVISSPSHPNQQLWYPNSKPQFTWFVAEKGLGYAFNLDQTPINEPSNIYYSQDEFFSFSQIADGFWYFHLKTEYSDGWGPTAHFQVKIDTTPPEFFAPTIEKVAVSDTVNQYRIYFSALDKHSGVAYYQVKIDNGEWQLVQSPYSITQTDQQATLLTLKAVDGAGNFIEVSIDPQKMIVLEEFKPKEKLPVEPEVKLSILENTREIIYRDILDNKQVEAVSKNIVTPALLGLSLANLLSSLWPFLSYFPYLHLLFTEPLLWFFRRRRKKWGVVYDSLSKKPLDFSVVRLHLKEGNQIVKTVVTDKDGRYLINVKEPNFYYLTVQKPEYVFPTEYLKKLKSDAKYLDVYHGGILKIEKKDSAITLNIPLDPVGKKLSPAKEIVRHYLALSLRTVISYMGIFFALAVLIIAPSIATAAALGVHVLFYTFFQLYILPRKPKNWGYVYDKKTKQPVSLAVVRLFDVKYNKLLEMQVTDSNGHYGFLVSDNVYQLLIEKQGWQKEIIKPVDLVAKERIINLDVALVPEKINNTLPKPNVTE